MSWYLKVMRQYVDFSGRARRKEYWMFVLVYFLMTLVIGVVEGVLGIGSVVSGVFVLVHLLPSLGVAVRRLHDTGRNGLWVLLAFLPLIGALILLYFMVLEGDPQTNDYGPDPKAV